MNNACMNDLFSVPVAECQLDIDVKEMSNECLNYSLNNPTVFKSNAGGYQSGDISKINSSVFTNFFKQLKEEVNRYQNHIKCPKINMDSFYCWININDKKNHNVPHTHPKSIISGAFYVKVPENSGRIQFQNPAVRVMESYWEHYCDEYTKYNSVIWSIQPEEKKLLLFPSWLVHSVEPNYSNEKRISISFNLSGQ